MGSFEGVIEPLGIAGWRRTLLTIPISPFLARKGEEIESGGHPLAPRWDGDSCGLPWSEFRNSF